MVVLTPPFVFDIFASVVTIYISQICGSFMIINGTIHVCASTATGVPVAPVEADIPPHAVSHR